MSSRRRSLFAWRNIGEVIKPLPVEFSLTEDALSFKITSVHACIVHLLIRLYLQVGLILPCFSLFFTIAGNSV